MKSAFTLGIVSTANAAQCEQVSEKYSFTVYLALAWPIERSALVTSSARATAGNPMLWANVAPATPTTRFRRLISMMTSAFCIKLLSESGSGFAQHRPPQCGQRSLQRARGQLGHR